MTCRKSETDLAAERWMSIGCSTTTLAATSPVACIVRVAVTTDACSTTPRLLAVSGFAITESGFCARATRGNPTAASTDAEYPRRVRKRQLALDMFFSVNH